MNSVERSKGSIRLAFKEPIKKLSKNPKQQSLIFLHFNYGSLRMKYSTEYSSCYADWDFERQQLRNKAHILDRDYVNDFLNGLKVALSKEISRLNADNIPITKKILREKLDSIVRPTIDIANEEMTFYNYTDLFCNRRKGVIRDVTLRSYQQTVKLLRKYEKKLQFNDITMDFYYAFLTFLEEDDKSMNTIGKHIKNLKSFLKSATEEGYNTNLAYSNREFRAPKELTTAIYLTDDEINSIIELDLNKHPELDRARDIFVIGCLTGQRVSDYNGLTNDNIINLDGTLFFKIRQSKTKKEVHCPITREIKEIHKKYNGSPPPRMREQDLNRYIKEIARRANVLELVERNYTKGGDKVSERVPKYKLVCTHSARRSFCTNMYKKGMSTYDIMIFSGHSTEKEFYKYIRIEKEQQALKFAKSGYFNI
ncbi:site-specific integrase [Joostella atrarenae]|uniref:Site-specific integrase n=1 Tax=Joostella atrarenae TaxID=679257 RepID=A0ABS9J4U5_9FLAO|nr:site-specific integrase [Joostella atrarenae]MCF8715461.1 site-specific integrase [Joostella atrarenae]